VPAAVPPTLAQVGAVVMPTRPLASYVSR
jgi:hypothetical protein